MAKNDNNNVGENEGVIIVPYQLCPKCLGQGEVFNNMVVGTSVPRTLLCDVCRGAKIIPMFATLFGN